MKYLLLSLMLFSCDNSAEQQALIAKDKYEYETAKLRFTEDCREVGRLANTATTAYPERGTDIGDYKFICLVKAKSGRHVDGFFIYSDDIKGVIKGLQLPAYLKERNK